MGTDMGDISTNHNHSAISSMTAAVADSRGTHCTPHPPSAADHTALWLMDAPIATCTMTHLTGIIAPHPTLATSADITLTTIPQTGASLTPATFTALHGKHSQWGKPSYTQDLQPPYIPPFQDCHHPGIPIRLFLNDSDSLNY